MSLYRNKFRIETTRIIENTYSDDGLYFITICVKNHCKCFGDVLNGRVVLNEIGMRANLCWKEIPRHFPFVKLHEYVIMPDHIHGIIEITKPKKCDVVENFDIVETQNLASLPPTPSQSPITSPSPTPSQSPITSPSPTPSQSPITSPSPTPLQSPITSPSPTPLQSPITSPSPKPSQTQTPPPFPTPSSAKNKFGPQSKNIASIIRGFKIGVRIWTKENNIPFEWQTRFYDHIIRSGEDYERIRKYIIDNPANWEIKKGP